MPHAAQSSVTGLRGAIVKIRTHQYAEAAYPLVNKIQNDPHEAKYRTLALTFPTLIMQSGLAQAIGFLMGKGGPEHKILLGHIETILNRPQLHDDILNSGIAEYQLLTRQALDATSWLKRYTQALLSKEGDPSW